MTERSPHWSDETWYTVKDITEILGVNKVTVNKWVKDETIPSLRIGGTIRIPKSKMDDLVEKSSRGYSSTGTKV